MRKLLAIAALLLISTAAHAQYTFDYGGRTIRIDPDRGTVSIPGVYDNTGPRGKRSHNDQDANPRRTPTPDQAKADPQAPPAVPVLTDPPSASAKTSPDASTDTANVTPKGSSTPTQPGAASAPDAQQDLAPAAAKAAPAVVATAPVSPPQNAMASASQTAQSSNTPLGLWLTEEKEGRIRIEQCGVTLCGYSVDAKSNQNGEQVLINMKPAKDSKWSGRILDPNTGSTYDSTIALQGTDALRVEGCAFGRMFCGGQTWSRLN